VYQAEANWDNLNFNLTLLLPTFSHQALAEIGKAKQAYGPMAPAGFQKLWAISKKYGPWQ